MTPIDIDALRRLLAELCTRDPARDREYIILHTLADALPALLDRIGELEAALREWQYAALELFVVAELREDNVIPHPADDPKLWSARMQSAWDQVFMLLKNHPDLNDLLHTQVAEGMKLERGQAALRGATKRKEQQ